MPLPACVFEIPDLTNPNRKVCKACGIPIIVDVPPEQIGRVCPVGKPTEIQNLIKSTRPGVGTELKLLLSKFRLRPVEGCQCDQRADAMNEMGIGWCDTNKGTILDWLQEEAKKRHLPFVRQAALVLVKLAIYNARKKMAVWERNA